MRFIGSKRSLLTEIDKALSEVITGEEEVFCDLFAGTGAVAEYFKPRYTVISNDLLHFSHVLQKASLENNTVPSFEVLKNSGIEDPFAYLLETPVDEENAGFIYNNYAPKRSGRQYFTDENALRIDFIRQTLEDWKNASLIDDSEQSYLLAALLEGIPYASNITGTYGAYLKHWDQRALAPLKLIPKEVTDNGRENKSYCEDSNILIRRLKGDILYLDPPYNSRQYLPNYHILETVSRWDSPSIKGVTGVRPYKTERSAYCSRKKAKAALEELIRLADFTHILLSYSGGGILPVEEIEAIFKKYGQPFTYRRFTVTHDKYRSKESRGKVEEYLFYIRKKPFPQTVFASTMGDQQLLLPASQLQDKWARVATPFRYNGNKYRQLDELFLSFPENCGTFVDLFCGSCSVAANFPAKKTICNDNNYRLIELLSAIRERDEKEILDQIDQKMRYYDLGSQNEAGYHAFREDYNRAPDPIDLYLLSCYSFNYQLRFNSRMEYNNSFGRDRSYFSPRMRRELIRFKDRLEQMNVTFLTGDFAAISLEHLCENDLIFCDPPYLSTTGSYNDGNRGPDHWSAEDEKRLMDYLDAANEKGIPFVMTNVLEYEDGVNEALLRWSEKYTVLPMTARKGSLREVIIKNR